MPQLLQGLPLNCSFPHVIGKMNCFWVNELFKIPGKKCAKCVTFPLPLVRKSHSTELPILREIPVELTFVPQREVIEMELNWKFLLMSSMIAIMDNLPGLDPMISEKSCRLRLNVCDFCFSLGESLSANLFPQGDIWKHRSVTPSASQHEGCTVPKLEFLALLAAATAMTCQNKLF